MNLYDVIKTCYHWKVNGSTEASKYVFEVDTQRSKLLIEQAVEAAFEGVSCECEHCKRKT